MTPSLSRSRKKKLRRSEMRLGRSYEQIVAQEELPLRPASRPRVRIGPRAFSLFLALALVSLIAYLFTSDAFYVSKAVLRGNSLVSAEEIYQGSEVQGYSIFFIHPPQVAKAIRGLPEIRDAKVTVRLPDQMIAEVRERQARIIWMAGQDRYGVDEEGTILLLRGAEPSIFVRDSDAAPRQVGGHIDRKIVAAAERYNTLLPDVSEFDYSEPYGLSVVNEHGWRIYLGNAEGAAVKVAIVNALAQRLASQDMMIEFIDLRFQGSPYYHLAGG